MSNIVKGLVFAAIMLAAAFGERAGLVSEDFSRTIVIVLPLLPDRGAAYAAELQKNFASDIRTISLDRMETALAAAGVKAPPIVVDNTPPRIFVSYSPAILVPNAS